MSIEHTPTPWCLSASSNTIIKQDFTHIGLGEDSGVQIGSACGYTGSGFFPSDEEGVANAEFIVRACNAHDQLVASLKAAVATIEDYVSYEHNGDPWTEDARVMGEMDIDDYSTDGRLEAARAALAAAGAA